MAKKIDQTFKAKFTKNEEKSGAWLCEVTITDDNTNLSWTSAWANARVAKNWAKALLVENTPRKSVKYVVEKLDVSDKPSLITGEVTYKVTP